MPMTRISSLFSRLFGSQPSGRLSLPSKLSGQMIVGATGEGRKSDLALKIEASGARSGEIVAIDEQGQARVVGRKPEVVVDNNKQWSAQPSSSLNTRETSMNIRASITGQMQLNRPQQKWNDGRGSDPAIMQVASFAGQELMVITDDNGGFELHYLGFTEGPYPSMDHAKAEAAKFAIAVLDVMKSKIVI